MLRRWSWSFWSKLELDIKSASALELLNQIGLSKTSYIPWGGRRLACYRGSPTTSTFSNTQ